MTTLNPQERSFYVYQLRVQGKRLPFYIGKGKADRYRRHWTSSSLRARSYKNHIIKGALQAGLEVYSEILIDGLTEAEAFRHETSWISRLGSKYDGTGCLVNLTAGGEGSSGYRWTAESRKRLSESCSGRKHSDETRALISSLVLGRTHSDETKQKISESNRAVGRSEAHRQALAERNRGRVWDRDARVHMSVMKSTPDAIYRSKLALNNPLFELVAQNTRRLHSRFRCRHCGLELERQNHTMLAGKVPKEHYSCAKEVFDLDRGTRVYSTLGSRALERIVVESPEGVEFTFRVRPQGIIFFDLQGAELYRVELPVSYTQARIQSERRFNNI